MYYDRTHDPIWRKMTPSPSWELWEGQGYPSSKLNPIIYYYPGSIDIEESNHLHALVDVIHVDGITPDKRSAGDLVDKAIVVHGQVVDIEGELHCYFGPAFGEGEDGYQVTHKATWVELDEYAD